VTVLYQSRKEGTLHPILHRIACSSIRAYHHGYHLHGPCLHRGSHGSRDSRDNRGHRHCRIPRSCNLHCF
jgi:hypothetical protein